jgi:hypothetical protein
MSVDNIITEVPEVLGVTFINIFGAWRATDKQVQYITDMSARCYNKITPYTGTSWTHAVRINKLQVIYYSKPVVLDILIAIHL